jgi:sugar lactone lactonase YvrE
VETLASGYGLGEAPCWGEDGRVYFSDVLGGGVHRWSPDEGVETVIPKRRGIGGMCLHADGGLVVSGRDVSHVKDGESRVLFEREGVTGFNDLAVHTDGRVYVGALRFMPFAGEEPVPGEIWRIDAAGAAGEIFGNIGWPNGIGFSPDGETVYACDFAVGEVLAYDGEASRVLVRTESGDADGLAVDVEGGIWVALGGGGAVARYSPSGDVEDVIDVPADFVSSLCFGGADGRDLYVTTAGALFRGRVDVAGLPQPRATV